MAGANKAALAAAKRILGITPRQGPIDALRTPAQRLHAKTKTHPIIRLKKAQSTDESNGR